jgi:hypothetical protein
MGRYLKRIKWQASQCPQCKTWSNVYIYIYRNGACARTYGTKLGKWAFDPNAIKAKATFRVIKVEDKWVKHPTNPAWKDGKPVTSCCKNAKVVVR